MFCNLGPIISNSKFINSSIDTNYFNVCHFNAQSMAPRNNSMKFDEIKHLFDDCKYDIIGVSETWLKSYISDKSVEIKGFKTFRNDRCWRRGGGVSLYISDKLKVRLVSNYMNEGIVESLFVEIIKNNNDKLLIGVIYLPHGNFADCEDFISDLSSRYENTIIMGDFNTDLFVKSATVRSFCFRSNLSIVHNSLPTHIQEFHNTSTLIDYFFVSKMDLVKTSAQYQIPALNSGHAIISLSYKFQISGQSEEKFYRDYRNIDIDKCISCFNELSDSNFFYVDCVETQSELFGTIVKRAFDEGVPLRKFNRVRTECWMNSYEVRTATLNRDLAWSAYCENNTLNNRRIFCKYRNKAKYIIRKERKRYNI